ncbi:HAD-IC family P-type ATPase [Clostridium algidicarnis]|uniref:HAD-IC family P-type ATPase n=1 Tax=Clostridium algidicarnis TaxID=37659 RepID=UPI001C0DD13E|nr:HAD-IC family P-type ATPase [Clostridium algidicarnis]MBU3210484.1 HAD-IC family P-type ATPase [Clostridium algidicarnis]MBU3228148.1 HAD-IC family P-type ATPase [Clostridium algidicarnis]MBU3252032.1 HAD-IC family P-type ATPase [Clostridium algidicarnis]
MRRIGRKRSKRHIKNNDEHLGLTDYDVKKRVREGKVNKNTNTSSKSVWNIIRGNLFTLFNGINLILLIIVIAAGSPKNGLFAGVIITNSLVGIIQELNAKKVVERLSMLNAITVTVIRNGVKDNIAVEQVVLDDVISLSEGEQIVVDSKVLTEQCLEIDESLLTGESESIKKCKGDTVLAGSLVLGGTGLVRATHVGPNTYAAKLAREAKKFKLAKSELQLMMDKILKVTIKIILPIGTLLILTQLINTDRDWKQAVISAVSGVVGMIPEGLVLLITTAFIVSIVRLSKWKTLVQELPATEILARVDTLCLDKTGTITEGKLKLEEIVPLNNNDVKFIEEVLSVISTSFGSSNATLGAIKEKYSKNKEVKINKCIPFNSAKKWSGVEFTTGEKWLIGAPEIILGEKYEEFREVVETEAKNGRRVLILAKINSGDLTDELSKDVEAVSLILFEDIIREDAKETLNYFEKQKVDIKIISGDNPVTVSSVSKKAGLKDAENYIDSRELPEDEEELAKVVNKTTVFGRTTPHQKKAIIKALQRNKRTVAMTGDGVNDVLALKQADCGIAMASGSDASKAVAQLVLLDSNFNALPHVVAEGRRIINNIENASNLFLSKMIYSIIMSIVFCILFIPYPIMPIQLTLIGSITIGIPSFFLALEPNCDMVKQGFFKRVLKESIPNGVAVAVTTIVVFLVSYYNKLPIEQCRTLAVIVMGGVSLIVLFKASRPFTKVKLYLNLVTILVFIFSLIVPISRKFFMIYSVNFYYIILALILVSISPLIIKFTKVLVGKPLQRRFG